jgi:hypothetical protein
MSGTTPGQACRRFTDARFRDIGVANDGETYIVTIAVTM